MGKTATVPEFLLGSKGTKKKAAADAIEDVDTLEAAALLVELDRELDEMNSRHALLREQLVARAKAALAANLRAGRSQHLYSVGEVTITFRETYSKVPSEHMAEVVQFLGEASGSLLDFGADVKLADGASLDALKTAAGNRWPEVEKCLAINQWAKLKGGTLAQRATSKNPALDIMADATMASPQVRTR